MAAHFRSHADKMAAQIKHVSHSGSQTLQKKVKRQVGVSTFEKRQHEFDRQHQSSVAAVSLASQTLVIYEGLARETNRRMR